MIITATVIFILCIAFWAGYRGVARIFGDTKILYVLKRHTFGIVLMATLTAAMAAITLFAQPSVSLTPLSSLILVSSIIMVLAFFSCLRLSTSAVTAFWGAFAALMYHHGMLNSTLVAVILISMLAAPLLCGLLTWGLQHLFNRHVFDRESHLLLNVLLMKRLALAGVLLAAVTLSVNCSLLFSTLLFTGTLNGLGAINQWCIILATAVTFAVGVMLWRPSEDEHHTMRQELPSLYAQATTLLTGNVIAILMMPLSTPVIISLNQIKASSHLLVSKSEMERQSLRILSITLLTPVVAFGLCSLLTHLVNHAAFTIALSVFTLLVCLLIHLYFTQYSKHRQTKNALRDELLHKDKVGDELNRMDLAAVTSQFDMMSKEIDLKHKELINLSLYIKQQRQYLEELSQRLNELSHVEDAQDMGIRLRDEATRLTENIKLSAEMDQFYTQVEKMHENFVSRLLMRCPNLTEREKRLAILLRLGLSSKEIAQFMNVEPKSVEISRYRFRRKLKLDHGINIVEYLQLL